MAGYSFLPPANFLGLPLENSGLMESQAIILPIPYEATTSYGGGAKNGPAAILDASAQVEVYDTEFGNEPARLWGICTLPALSPELRGPEAMVEAIAAAVAEITGNTQITRDQGEKLLCVLGGEHIVSAGVARGLSQLKREFLTVQLDAHADLRQEHDGTPYSHACTARRILDHSPLIQLGIRSLDISEANFIREQPDRVTTVFAEAMHQDRSYLQGLAAAVKGRAVYLTLDLDVLDPSLMPAVGTPEPGGLLWHDILEIVRTIATHSRIIAFDCAELAPIPGLHAPNFIAAKLVYKILSIILAARNAEAK